MSKVCIIPARGGSKRIPGKNVRDFLGKPIIAYSIEVALKSGLFNEVMVSTDDDEIAQIAIKYGASVPFIRSQKNSNDYATTMNVIDEVLKNYIDIQGKSFQYACCIYPTAPLTDPIQLKKGYEKLVGLNFTSVSPIVAYSYPIWRGLSIDENGTANMIWPKYLNSRSQDLRKVYHDAGQWYWYTVGKLKNWNWPDNAGVIELSELQVQDIDTISDWKLAEMKFKLLSNSSK